MKLVDIRRKRYEQSKSAEVNIFSQDNFARKVGITGNHYRNIEKGRSLPTVKVAIKICKLLRVSVYDIDEWNND